MILKSGKFLADWRDENGRRHRKAFLSKSQALRFQHKQAHDAASKKARASAHSANLQRRGARPGRSMAASATPRSSSRKPLKASRPIS